MANLQFRSLLFITSILTQWNFKSVSCQELNAMDLISPDQPRFITRGETYRVVNGDSVILPCQAENLNPYSIVWKRGNAVLTAVQLKLTPDPRIELVDGFNLKVSKVRTQDGGDYTCQISTYIPIEQTHTLEILVPPSVSSDSNNGHVTIIKGDTVTLKCRGNGNPAPSIRWTRRNNLLPNGEQSFEGNSLTIQKADRHQAGMYVCSANNGVGSPATSVIEVKVQYPPEIEVERSWIHSGEGYEAKLACIVHSDPPASVRWYRDTMILDTTDRRLLEERGSKHSLIIRIVQPMDFGNYSCEADNKLGRTKRHMELSGKPNRAVFQSDPSGRSRDSYNITWIVESFSPITEYRLLYRKSHVNDTHDIPGEWNDVVLPATDYLYYQGNSLAMPRAVASLAASSPVLIAHVKSYYIKNLEPEAIYEAQVAARNKYGWAQPSELYSFHTRRTDHYPFVSSPQHDVLAEPEIRDLGITAASSSARTVHPTFSLKFLSLIASFLVIDAVKNFFHVNLTQSH